MQATSFFYRGNLSLAFFLVNLCKGFIEFGGGREAVWRWGKRPVFFIEVIGRIPHFLVNLCKGFIEFGGGREAIVEGNASDQLFL
jgi:hypothetical protein